MPTAFEFVEPNYPNHQAHRLADQIMDGVIGFRTQGRLLGENHVPGTGKI